jgi:hypothetical protein
VNNLDKWDRIYGGMVKGDYGAFGNVETYERAKAFLKDCAKIEDRGCGRAFFSTLFPAGQVINIDGTQNPNVDIHADLEEYRSVVPGIMMRHVLEHNYQWQKVLACAVESFTERMVLVLYTPLVKEPVPPAKEWHGFSMEVLDLIECWGNIPVLSLRQKTIEDLLTEHNVSWLLEENISSACDFKYEHIYYLQK